MKTKLILLTVLTLILGACGKQNKKSSTRVNRYQANQVVSGTTSCSQATWGRIFENNLNPEAYRQRIADFTLRSLDELGTLSPLQTSDTGVEFQMTLQFANGQLVQQNSKAVFKITDSFTQQGEGYIQFAFNNFQGQGMNGQFSAVLSDDKGSVKLEAQKTTYQGQPVYYGRATYSNYQQAEQNLGEFYISTCAVVGI